MIVNKMLGLYIHIPFCKSKCGYCSFYSKTDNDAVPLFLRAVKKEIEHKASKYCVDKNSKIVDTVYFGGGTPSTLPSGAITEIFTALRSKFNIVDTAEITVEVNPDSASESFIQECVKNGVNRVSLGLQSHDDKVLKILSRRHNFAEFENAVKIINKAGITNISADIMSGLPEQSFTSLEKTIKLVASNPTIKHISLYALTVEENTLLYDSGYAVDSDMQADMYDKSVILLDSLGFKRYEVSNFCKGELKSQHNSKYWNHSPYLGFGPSACSFVNNKRIDNVRSLAKYNVGGATESVVDINKEELLKEYIMLSLRTSDGLDANYILSEHKYDILTSKKTEIDMMEQGGLISVDNGVIKVTSDGFYLLNSIIIKFV